MRSRIGRVAVGPSAVRGTRRETAEAARRFLRQLPLRSFRAPNREALSGGLIAKHLGCRPPFQREAVGACHGSFSISTCAMRL